MSTLYTWCSCYLLLLSLALCKLKRIFRFSFAFLYFAIFHPFIWRLERIFFFILFHVHNFWPRFSYFQFSKWDVKFVIKKILKILTYSNSLRKRTWEIEFYPNKNYHKNFCKHFSFVCVLLLILYLYLFSQKIEFFLRYFTQFSLSLTHCFREFINSTIIKKRRKRKFNKFSFFTINFPFFKMIFLSLRKMKLFSSKVTILVGCWNKTERCISVSCLWAAMKIFYCIFVLSRMSNNSRSKFFELLIPELSSNLKRRFKNC
jgi:hypothetical protein